MLRVFGLRRSGPTPSAAASTISEAPEFTPVQDVGPQLADDAAQAREPGKRRIFTWKRAMAASLILLVIGGGTAYYAKEHHAAEIADLSRRIIGDEKTARVEGWVFKVEDRLDKLKYRVLGGDENPFDVAEIQVQFVERPPAKQVVYYANAPAATADSEILANAFAPIPMMPPATKVLSSDPQPGEAAWTTVGLPRSTPNDMLMAKTFIRPDKSRPYASVGVLLIDTRRIRMHMVGGTVDPGGSRQVKGPGVIPKDHYANLLVAWNGGFKGDHGNYGMVANGKEYQRMRNGLATVCTAKDGTITMGEYGRDFGWNDWEACRQNVILLVDKGEVSRRTTEGNDTWGYVNVDSSEFITWRSAMGITKDGKLMIAAGNSLSAATLAQAMQAAGAYMAMQLDINAPYIATSLFFPQPDGSLKAQKFMDNMAPSASTFLGTRERDFLYVTLDESRYR